MKKFISIVAIALVSLGSVACTAPSKERAVILKEVADFQKKCRENPNDAECVKFREQYSGS